MPYADLREWLQRLEQEGEISRIKVEVEKDHEIGAICRRVNSARGPALYFERVKGFDLPVVCNLVGTRRRYALALETTPERLTEEWYRRSARFIDPVIVREGACQEVVYTGEAVDLLRFPHPIWNELDAGPYITQPIVISRDPETGIRNTSMYRMQVHDRRTVGILGAPYRHVMQHRGKARAAGRPLPVAIALGADPTVCLACTAPLPFAREELGLAGALRQAPVELVRCKTVDLEVPATAEIVLEGEIPLERTQAEGPYGEFTGYYGFTVNRPVVEVKAVTHRRRPIYHGLYNGRPPTEEHLLRGIPIEMEMVRECPLPGVIKLNLTEGGCASFTAVVSIRKAFEGYGKMVALSLLGTWAGRFVKHLIVVDEDIDPYDWTQVEWALATRVQPHRDVEILRDLVGVILDPSLPFEERRSGKARTSKMIIDATRYDAEEFEVPCLPERQVMERVEREWGKYGIPL